MEDVRGQGEHFIRTSPNDAGSGRLEAFCQVVAVQASRAVIIDGLRDVFGDVARRLARLPEPTLPDAKVTDQLDADKPPTPSLLDDPVPEVVADQEVHVQPMTTRMPLRHLDVGKCLAPGDFSKSPEELPDMGANLPRIMTTGTLVGQCPQPVQPVLRTVTT